MLQQLKKLQIVPERNLLMGNLVCDLPFMDVFVLFLMRPLPFLEGPLYGPQTCLSVTNTQISVSTSSAGIKAKLSVLHGNSSCII